MLVAGLTPIDCAGGGYGYSHGAGELGRSSVAEFGAGVGEVYSYQLSSATHGVGYAADIGRGVAW